MQIVLHPHPALRFKSTDVRRIDEPFRAVIREMFSLMYESGGVGLAANQIGLPLRFFVMNHTGEASESEAEQVFINPVIRNRRGQADGEEGCLSLPDIRDDVRRAEKITVEAFDITGQPFRANLEGFLARIVQHENDHLDGILFLDRISDEDRMLHSQELAALEETYRRQQSAGEIPSDTEIRTRLKAIAAAGHLL